MFGEIPKNPPCGRLAVVEMPEGVYAFYAWNAWSPKLGGNFPTILAGSNAPIEPVKKFSKKFNINAGKATYIGNIHFIIGRKKAVLAVLRIPVKKTTVDVEIRNMQDRDLSVLYKKYPNIANEKVQIKIIENKIIQNPIQQNTANEKYPQLPKMLDGKGFFVVSKIKAARLKIKSVKVSDWLFEDKGGLVDRDMLGFIKYDISGNIIEFSGHKDQGGYIKNEYKYADNNLSEVKLYIKAKEGMKYVGKRSLKYIDGRKTESIDIDNTGKIKARKNYMYDTAGNNIATRIYFNGKDYKTITKFDKFGNILEMDSEFGKVLYSYDKHKVTVSRLIQNNQLHLTSEYTFDKDWNLLSYFWKSGNGEYWYRFTYKYNADALPIEKVWSRGDAIEAALRGKVWSRKEVEAKNPYELTKYSYQHFK